MTSISTLNFGVDLFNALFIEDASDYKLEKRHIVINIGEHNIHYNDNQIIKPYKSKLITNVCIKHIESAIIIPEITEINNMEILNKWDNLFDITNNELHEKLKLWMSPKINLGNLSVNLWYAPKDTHCGIHNEHDFKEVHTQIFGLGHMEVFSSSHHNDLHTDVFMPLGYTHSPFFNENGNYPWHQYRAETDCIWMALEY